MASPPWLPHRSSTRPGSGSAASASRVRLSRARRSLFAAATGAPARRLGPAPPPGPTRPPRAAYACSPARLPHRSSTRPGSGSAFSASRSRVRLARARRSLFVAATGASARRLGPALPPGPTRPPRAVAPPRGARALRPGSRALATAPCRGAPRPGSRALATAPRRGVPWRGAPRPGSRALATAPRRGAPCRGAPRPGDRALSWSALQPASHSASSAPRAPEAPACALQQPWRPVAARPAPCTRTPEAPVVERSAAGTGCGIASLREFCMPVFFSLHLWDHLSDSRHLLSFSNNP